MHGQRQVKPSQFDRGPPEGFFSAVSTKLEVHKLHTLLVNKFTCREYQFREKGGRGFGCLRKKEEECMLLFGGGQQAGQT